MINKVVFFQETTQIQDGHNTKHYDHFEYPKVDLYSKNCQDIALYFFGKLHYMLEK